MDISAYPQAIADAFPGCEIESTGPRRFWVVVPRETFLDSVKIVREKLECPHLCTIIGEDMRDHMLNNYPFAGPVVITLRIKIDREAPEFPSLSGTLEGASVYERELHDLFGMTPVGLADLSRQVLPDSFPEGVYPLRKDVVLPRGGGEPLGGE